MPQEQRDFVYRVFEINTTATFSAKHFAFDGEILAYMSPINGPDLYMSINEREGDKILFTPKSKFIGKVRELWLDLNEVATGIDSIKLYVASKANQLIESNEIRVASVEHTTALAASQASVDSSASLLVGTAAAARQRLRLKNMGLVNVFIGGSTVTGSTGYLLAPGEELDIQNFTGAVYAITNGGTSLVSVLTEG